MESFPSQAEAVSSLQAHFETYVTEETIANISAAGFNHLRIPIGYWAWMTQIDGAPYAFQAGQVDYLTKALGWAQKYGLYVMIDMHGLPGSQNGQDNSGHEGLNGWYGQQNQDYSDQLIDTVLAYIEQSPYRDVISSIEACNEPVYYSADQFNTLAAYYERVYTKITAMADPVPMLFHPGSENNNPLGSWQPFITGKNASLLVLEIHPYIGRGQSLAGAGASEATLITQLCALAQSYQGYGVPVAITEWSLTSPIINNATWENEWFGYQVKEYAQSGGGCFWNFNVGPHTLYAGTEIIEFYQYSLSDLISLGSVPLPAFGQTSQQYIQNLPSVCGTQPTETWDTVVPSKVTPTTTGNPNSKRYNRWQ